MGSVICISQPEGMPERIATMPPSDEMRSCMETSPLCPTGEEGSESGETKLPLSHTDRRITAFFLGQ